MCSFLCVAAKFQLISASLLPFHRTGEKLTEIGWHFAAIQRNEHTRLQVSLFQFISCYSPVIWVLILYSYPIKTLRWHPVAWTSCDDIFWGFSGAECWPAPISPHEKPNKWITGNRKVDLAARALFHWSHRIQSLGFQGFLLPEYINNKESSRVKKEMALASALANRWLFSSSFLICLSRNVSKQFRVTGKY